MAHKKLGQMLIDAGLLAPAALRRALDEQARSPAPLGVKLIKLGLVSETDLLLTLSQQLDSPAAQLDGRRIPDELIALMPLELAEQYGCIPLFSRGEGQGREVFLGMTDPSDMASMDELSFRLGCRVRPVLVLHGQLVDAIDRHYRQRAPGGVLAQDFDAFSPELELGVELHADAEPALEPVKPEATFPLGEAIFGEALFQPVRATDVESPDGQPSTRAVLRAVVEVLVERGLIAPDDIQRRLRRRGR